MRRFADLQLRVSLKDMVHTQKMVKKALELGYNLIGIPFPPAVNQEQIRQLKHICYNTGVDFVSRVNFSPNSSNELLSNLRRYRKKFEIIGVRCNRKEVARQAAKDRRVDIINFSATNIRQRFFDEQEAELASHSLSSFEIELAPLLQLTSVPRIRILSCLRKEKSIAERANVPITLSSGATTEQLMRNPHDCAAIATLFDLSSSSALKALAENPLEIVDRNRKKLSHNYVAPGIRFLGRKNGD